MSLFKFKDFRHGIHPPDNKDETNHLAIQRFPFAPLIVLPLRQHIGRPSIEIVREGEEVARGQMIAKADGLQSVPLHAPTTGTIKKIDLVPSISGEMVKGIYLETAAASTQEVIVGKPCHLESATPAEIIQAIQDAGIVGLGGAAFPTHLKISIPEGKSVDTLVVNGSECEPYLTTDHRVMLEQTEQILLGIRYILKATGATRAIIGVELNKPDAVAALREKLPPQSNISVESLPAKYPQGAEKMLIKSLLNREVPPGQLPVAVNVVGINVATAAETGRLLPLGRGIQERIITITGPAIINKGNYRIPIGTPLRFILDEVGVKNDISSVFIGGPMMGHAVPNLDIAITKGNSGIVAFTAKQMKQTRPEYACIHCGHCVDACPMGLNPSQMGLLAMNQRYVEMEHEFHLMDCFECGSCAFICPSHIPLVQYFRVAKQRIKEIQVA